MGHFILEFGRNRVFLIVILAWVIAQSLKVAVGIVREHRFNFKWFVGAGGMPSSHAASVMALATAVGLSMGFESPFFAIALVFAVITMFDAQGVRRASGKQAIVLNRIVDDLYFHRPIQEAQLKELLGHTPVEVLAGAAIGVIVAFWFW